MQDLVQLFLGERCGQPAGDPRSEAGEEQEVEMPEPARHCIAIWLTP